MNEERSQKSSQEYDAWKQNFMMTIRKRSSKSSSQLRKEDIERQIEEYDSSSPNSWARRYSTAEDYVLPYYHHHPELGVSTL